MQGQVKWFDNSKGCGFIGRNDGPDVFVYYTAIVGKGYQTLNEGDSVEFEIVQGLKGPQAASVTKIPVHPKDHQAAKKYRKAMVRIGGKLHLVITPLSA